MRDMSSSFFVASSYGKIYQNILINLVHLTILGVRKKVFRNQA
ncbi:hypothetical protein HMPREF1868_00770 [Olsenella sp. DNF00959]|nr:hypothetical protein HMPREF1868_00770 [Olsenella sp. DNF00959]